MCSGENGVRGRIPRMPEDPSLIGLRHLEQARIPISERLKSGLGWIEGMMRSLCLAGALPNSLSPVDAEDGAVTEPACSPVPESGGQYCSHSKRI
jgi:hypothetical protein